MHLSYSQINLFKECAKLWQASYQLGKKRIPDQNLVLGSAIHKAVELRIAGKAPDLLKLWKTLWWEDFANKPGKVVWHMTKEECYETGVRIFSSKQVLALLDQIEVKKDPWGRPMIERKIEWQIDGLPPVIGFIDAIAADGVPIDFKTASRMWSPSQALREIQPLFYIAALNELGETDHNYRFRHFVITKGLFPVARVFESQRTPEQVEEMRQTVIAVWRKIEEGVFEANPQSWLCSPACPVIASCQAGREKWFGVENENMTNVMSEL